MDQGVWKYMTKLRTGRAQCKRCFKTYKITGNKTNCWNHLKTHDMDKPKKICQPQSTPSQETENSDIYDNLLSETSVFRRTLVLILCP